MHMLYCVRSSWRTALLRRNVVLQRNIALQRTIVLQYAVVLHSNGTLIVLHQNRMLTAVTPTANVLTAVELAVRRRAPEMMTDHKGYSK